MELKNKTTFNKLYQAACDLADRFRRGEWSNSDRSIEECEAAIKSLAAFIDDGKADCTDKREEAREKTLKGTWFQSVDFRRIIVHMQLEEAINNRDMQLELDILGHVLAYLPNGTILRWATCHRSWRPSDIFMGHRRSPVSPMHRKCQKRQQY
jgi:hypothetical protein